MAVPRVREDGFDLGHQAAVWPGHLELVLKVAAGAQGSRHDDAAVVAADEVAQQTVKGVDFDITLWAALCHLARYRKPLVEKKEVRCGGPRPHQAASEHERRGASGLRCPRVMGSKVPGRWRVSGVMGGIVVAPENLVVHDGAA